MAERLRISVCNLQSGIGTTKGYWQYVTTAWKYLLPHGDAPIRDAAAFLRSESVDLALLSEADGSSFRTYGVDHVDVIARETPLTQTAFFPTITSASRNQGNAVCTRFPVRPVENWPLPGSGEPRYLSEAEIRLGSTAIRVFATHLGLRQQVRASQLRSIASRVEDRDGPMLLGGDFNIADSAELELLDECELQPVAPQPTFPSWRPSHVLDRLFISPHFEVTGSRTFDRFRFSDHLPLLVDVTLHPHRNSASDS